MPGMHNCIISLAANCQQEENLTEARQRLCQILFSPSYTEAIWTEPFGSGRGNHISPLSPLDFQRDGLYLNQLVYAQTSFSAEQLIATLKEIECAMGRTQEDRQKGIVRIDLDLMQYDLDRYHLRDWDRPYIQALLR